MFNFLHRHRGLLHPAATLLLTAAFLHCAQEWQAELRYRFAVASYRNAGQPLPIGLPTPGCDHDSGCLCRGATFAAPVVVDCQAAADVWQWLELYATWQWSPADELAKHVLRPPRECLAPPLSGRQLRALYASLVI